MPSYLFLWLPLATTLNAECLPKGAHLAVVFSICISPAERQLQVMTRWFMGYRPGAAPAFGSHCFDRALSMSMPYLVLEQNVGVPVRRREDIPIVGLSSFCWALPSMEFTWIKAQTGLVWLSEAIQPGILWWSFVGPPGRKTGISGIWGSLWLGEQHHRHFHQINAVQLLLKLLILPVLT